MLKKKTCISCGLQSTAPIASRFPDFDYYEKSNGCVVPMRKCKNCQKPERKDKENAHPTITPPPCEVYKCSMWDACRVEKMYCESAVWWLESGYGKLHPTFSEKGTIIRDASGECIPQPSKKLYDEYNRITAKEIDDLFDSFPSEMTTVEASLYTGIRANTLAQWRMKDGKGPHFTKYKGKVTYKKEDLDRYLEENHLLDEFMLRGTDVTVER